MNMWGKNKKEDENIKNFTVGEDRHYDLFLAEFDCEGSIAHTKMLSKTGFLSAEEEKKIISVLQQIKKLVLHVKVEREWLNTPKFGIKILYKLFPNLMVISLQANRLDNRVIFIVHIKRVMI